MQKNIDGGLDDESNKLWYYTKKTECYGEDHAHNREEETGTVRTYL